MFTDPNRKRKTDPGNPDICNVFTLHKLYSHHDDVAMINRDCRIAKIGCVECKKKLAPHLVEFLAPIQERREYYVEHREAIDEILAEGNKKAQVIARKNLMETREAMGI